MKIYTKKQLEQEQNFKDAGIFFAKRFRFSLIDSISNVLTVIAIVGMLITLFYLSYRYFISVGKIVSGL